MGTKHSNFCCNFSNNGAINYSIAVCNDRCAQLNNQYWFLHAAKILISLQFSLAHRRIISDEYFFYNNYQNHYKPLYPSEDFIERVKSKKYFINETVIPN